MKMKMNLYLNLSSNVLVKVLGVFEDNATIGVVGLFLLISITAISMSFILKSLRPRSKSDSLAHLQKEGDLVEDKGPPRRIDLRCKVNPQGLCVVFNQNAKNVHESVLVQWLVRNYTELGLVTSKVPGFATVRGVTYSGWIFSDLQPLGPSNIYRKVYVEPGIFESLALSRGIHTDHMGVSPKYTDGMISISIKEER